MILLECTTNHHKLQSYLNKPLNKEMFETIKVRHNLLRVILSHFGIFLLIFGIFWHFVYPFSDIFYRGQFSDIFLLAKQKKNSGIIGVN